MFTYLACCTNILTKTNSGLFQSRFIAEKLIDIKFLSTNLNSKVSTLEVYKDIFPWENHKKLSKYILENGIIYKDGPLLAINKPYGLQIHTPNLQKVTSQQPKKITQTLNTVMCSNYKGGLDMLLPLLAQHLGYDSLQVVKSTERFSSGVIVLSSDASISHKIKKCYLRVASAKQLCQEYIALTVGAPQEKLLHANVAISLQQSKYSGMKQAIITSTTSKSSIGRNEAKLVKVEHDCLQTNSSGSASLVKISSSTTSWHFLRVYLASLLSPVLGDNVHGARVNFKGGQATPVNPFSHTAQLPMEVPPALLAQLGLTRKQQALIPVHLHLSKLIIPNFFNNKSDLVLQAPLPSTFLWTCDKLGLQAPVEQHDIEKIQNLNL